MELIASFILICGAIMKAESIRNDIQRDKKINKLKDIEENLKIKRARQIVGFIRKDIKYLEEWKQIWSNM